MKIIFRFGIIFLHFQFLGCDPGVEKNTSDIDELYSINSFISPQDTIYYAYIYHALELGSVSNLESAVVKDAEVILTNGTMADTLKFNENNNRYEAQKKYLTIEPLKSYNLIVNINNSKSIEATCTVPPIPDEPKVSGSKTSNDFYFEVSWENINYYKYFILSASVDGTYQFNSPTGERTAQLFARLDNGSFIEEQNNSNLQSGVVRNAYLSSNADLTILLRHIDENMFKYYDTYKEFDTWNSNSNESIPNFRDPKPLFSNIHGALGIFGAFNTQAVTIEIK